ncbi:MAG: hypothetical protein GY797_23445 [Deltaproteobacteria bacterium]|nr:hypothetical protein [Deltaproteobacteria bacterium]
MKYALVFTAIFLLIACNPSDTTVQPVTTPRKTATNVAFAATSATVFPTKTLPKPTPTLTPTISIPTPTGGNQYIAYYSGCNSCKSVAYLVVDSDGKGNALINPSGKRQGWKKEFSWSPDGEHLAFTHSYYYQGGGELYIADADGSNIQKIADLWSSKYSWSPDSNYLVFVGIDQDGMPNVFTKGIYGEESKQLTYNKVPDLIFLLPEWSPEGSNIAFISYHPNKSDKGKSETIYYVVDLNGTILLQSKILGGVIEHTIWSPDGKEIFLTKKNIVNEDGSYENHGIIAVDVNSKHIDTITTFYNTDIYPILPTLSPDGTLISYVSMLDGQKEVFIINTDGNNFRNVTNYTGDDNCPVWSPDGDQLLFSSERDGKIGIYKITMTDMKVQKLTNSSSEERLNCLHSWSPDGTQIAFGRGYVMNTDGRNVRRILIDDYAGAISWQPSP